MDIKSSIPSTISNLDALTEIHLDNNSLYGVIPDSLALLPNLVFLSLKNNNLSGNIPSSLVAKLGSNFEYSGNRLLGSAPALAPGLASIAKKKSSNVWVIVVSATGGVLVLGVVLGILIWSKRCRRDIPSSEPDEYPLRPVPASPAVGRISYESEKEAVNGEYGTWTKVGQLFVNEKIEDRLGSGSSGTFVFEGAFVQGRQENAVRPRPIKVAVKRLLTAHFKKAEKELDLLVTIRPHQNVVRYWCIEETKDFIYLGLERCNCSLHDLICAQSGKVVNMEEEVKQRLHWKGLKLRTEEDWELWDEDQQPSLKLLRVLRGIVEGLVHLHSQHIAHRDLKPLNILIIIGGAEMQAKIADMGLSKQWADTPISSDSLPSDGHRGTRGWQAPEQLRKEKLDEGGSQAADMFGLGCVLYYCITEGEHPFGDEVERESNIIRGNKNLFPGGNIISAEAEDLIERLLHPVSVKRPSARNVLNHPFFWNLEKRLSFLMDASDRLEGDRKKRPVPKFVADVESRMSKIQCSGWDSYVDPRLLHVKNRPNYDYTLVRDLLRLIRNRAHHFEDADSKAVLKSKPEGIVKYFASKFRRLLIEIYDVVGKHYEADDSFQKYYSVDT